MSASALVLTYNEEKNIERCLKSLQWCDEVVVLDSYSTDRTIEIAKKLGAVVVMKEFEDYASQRNYGLNSIDYKNEWVLMVDADEIVPPELAQEIRERIVQAPSQVTMFRIARIEHFLDGTLDHCMGNIWYGRLVRRGKVWVARKINEEYHTDGEILCLKNKLLHYPFCKGLTHWFDKHNKYSTLEAQEKLNNALTRSRMKDLLSRDPVRRRAALKRLGFRLRFRPLLSFVYMYLIKRGFLDGKAGFRYCLLRSIYEYMIDLKVIEKKISSIG